MPTRFKIGTTIVGTKKREEQIVACFIPGSRVDYRKNYSIITILLQLRDHGIFRDIGSFETGKRGTNGK